MLLAAVQTVNDCVIKNCACDLLYSRYSAKFKGIVQYESCVSPLQVNTAATGLKSGKQTREGACLCSVKLPRISSDFQSQPK